MVEPLQVMGKFCLSVTQLFEGTRALLEKIDGNPSMSQYLNLVELGCLDYYPVEKSALVHAQSFCCN